MTSTEDQGKKKCTGECGKLKDLSEFTRNQSQCKECRAKAMKDERRTAYGGLYKSCECAISRAKKTSGSYALVTCEFTSPAKFRDAIWGDELMRRRWILLWKRYEDSGFDPAFRPEIDRIDPSGDYTLENIQFLSKSDHAIKDGHKRMLDLFYLNADGQLCVERTTKKEAAREYSELDDVMQGGYGNGLLLQDASITVNHAKLVKRDKPKARQQALAHLASLAIRKSEESK